MPKIHFEEKIVAKYVLTFKLQKILPKDTKNKQQTNKKQKQKTKQEIVTKK